MHGGAVDRAGAAARAAWHDDRRRTRRVPGDADAEEWRPAGQQRSAWRGHSPSGRRVSGSGRAIVARGVTDAAIEGFRIVGDAATPLGTGVLAVDSELSISHVEITGAARAAIDVGRGSHVRVVGGDIRDNPGAAMAVRSGATAAVSHSVFTRNGTAGRDQKTLILEDGSTAQFTANVFVGTGANVFTAARAKRALRSSGATGSSTHERPAARLARAPREPR